MTIVLNGNLTIANTGDLTFKNVTLKMNVSGPKGILVNAGNFTILDNDNNPATTNDNSNITNNTPSASGYLFQVSPGSNFIIKNSELHYSSGLSINADYSTVQNNIISNNSAGISLSNGITNSAINNTFSNNALDGIFVDTSTGTSVSSNIAQNNNNYGAHCASSNPTTFSSGTNTMSSNGISNCDTCVAYGCP
jgi:parallel beta-helix repeat protein